MKRIILPIIGVLIVTLSVLSEHTPKLMVYRNDRKFNVVELDSTLEIRHHIEYGDSADVEDDVFAIKINGDSIPIQAIDSCVVRTVDIPTLRISLPDYPDRTQVWDKENYVNALITIQGNGMTDDTDTLSVNIKGRGNSTWGFAKKPMRLKFDKKTSLCGFKKQKSYVLLANYLDHTLMHNVLTMWVARRMGVPYANHTMPCNVYFNDKYIGSYLLTEKVGFNAGSIEDIDETEGVLIELSKEYDEKYKFKTTRYSLPAMIKDPDFDELYETDPSITPEERLALWEEDLNRACTASNFDEFDLASFVDYELILSFAQNSEVGHPKSVFIRKRNLEEGTKYEFGPVWDYDMAYNFLRVKTDGEGEYRELYTDGSTWQNYLFYNLMDSDEFQEAYAARFEEFESEIVPELLEFADSYAELIEPSARLDGLRWPRIETSNWYYRMPAFDNREAYQSLRAWIEARVEAMRAKLPKVL